MLPRKDRDAHPSEDSVRIFNAAGRAELWAAGNGNGHENGNGNGNGGTGVSQTNHAQDARATPTFGQSEPAENFSLISPAPEPDINYSERSTRNEPVTIEELGSAFKRSGFGRGNNGQSL
jgi:hypothetical protein